MFQEIRSCGQKLKKTKINKFLKLDIFHDYNIMNFNKVLYYTHNKFHDKHERKILHTIYLL